MKVKLQFILFLTISIVFTQGIYDQYDIPEYQYESFQLTGDDLFNSLSYNKTNTTTFNLGSNYRSVLQSPSYNLEYGVTFKYNGMSQSFNNENADPEDPWYDEDISTSDWRIDAPFKVSKYFDEDTKKGKFGFINGDLSMWDGDQYEGADDTSDLFITIGAGIGRVISTKPIAQAYAILDALEIEASDDKIMAIAAIIGAAASYDKIYKDNATQQYYNDLAEAAGSSSAAMKIQEVLTSPAYNISDKSTGWSAQAGLWNNYMLGEGEADGGALTLEGNYAYPIDANTQITVNLVYMMDMNDSKDEVYFISPIISSAFDAFVFPIEDDYYDYDYYDYDYDYEGGGFVVGGWSTMSLAANYTFDHSYNWTSSAGINYMSESYEMNNNYYYYYDTDDSIDISSSSLMFTASTTKAILNQLSVTASISHMTFSGDMDYIDPITSIKTTATYWIF